MKVLVIAPHPDDEVLGCGGTIAKYTKEGDDVYLCIITKAYTPYWSEDFIRNRVKEIEKANKILGIKKTYFLDYPTVKLDTIPQKELNDAISEVMNDVKPNILYIPHKGDLNKDHRLVFESSLVASRYLNYGIKKILSYETASEYLISPFVPNTYIDISETFYKKTISMIAYGSELKEYPHPRSIEIINALGKKRGSEVGVKFAEAFVLIREVIN